MAKKKIDLIPIITYGSITFVIYDVQLYIKTKKKYSAKGAKNLPGLR